MSEELKAVQAEIDALSEKGRAAVAEIKKAREAGDKEREARAQAIADKIQARVQTRRSIIESSYTERGGEDSDFLVGVGRGVMDLAQGAKQKGLMLKDLVTGGDEAESYTDEINQEQARYKGDMQRQLEGGRYSEDDINWAAGIGRIAGNTAPGLMAPGGAAAQIGIGALEAALMPTESGEWGDVAKQGLMGAGGGAVGAAIPAVVGGRLPSVRKGIREAIEEGRPNAFDTAANKDLPIPPRGRSGSVSDKLMHDMSERQITASQNTPALKAQRKAQESLRKLAQDNAGGFESGVKRGQVVARNEIDKAYNKAYGNTSKMRISRNQDYAKAINDIIDEAGGPMSDAKTLKQLARIRDDAPGRIIKDGEIVGYRPATVGEWHEYTSRIGRRLAKWGAKGRDTTYLKNAYWAARNHLNDAVRAKNPNSADLLEAADLTNKNYMGLMDEINLTDMRGGQALKALRGAEDATQAAAGFRQMDAIGRESAVGAILNDVLHVAGDPKYGLNFAKGRGRMRQYKNAIDGLEQAGLKNQADQLRGVGEWLSEVENVKTKDPDLFNVFAAAALSLGQTQIWPRLLMRDGATKRMLARLAKIPKGKKHRLKKAQLTRELMRRVTAQAGTGAAIEQQRPDVPQIEIRNGIPQ